MLRHGSGGGFGGRTGVRHGVGGGCGGFGLADADALASGVGPASGGTAGSGGATVRQGNGVG